MIIVSQDKKNIINFERADLINIYKAEEEQVVAWFSCNESENNNVLLGTYATEKRAKEILEEIIKAIERKSEVIQNETEIIFLSNYKEVYKMPEE